MTVPQLDTLLGAMKKRGFRIKTAKKANSTRPLDDSPASPEKSGHCGWKWPMQALLVTVLKRLWHVG